MSAPGPRRGHGEDSIYFDRANNCWVGTVSLGYKAGKGVRRKVTGRTKTDDWLARGLSGRSGRTLYRDTVRPWRARLGEVKLKDLTAGDVQETLDGLTDRLSTRSCRSSATAWSG